MAFLRFFIGSGHEMCFLARVRCEALLEPRGSHHSPLSPKMFTMEAFLVGMPPEVVRRR